jgi:hypothetical protein
MSGRGAVEYDGSEFLADDVLKILTDRQRAGVILRIARDAGNLRRLRTLGKIVDVDLV